MIGLDVVLKFKSKKYFKLVTVIKASIVI